MAIKDNFATTQEIDKLHGLYGKLLDAMNKGLITVKKAKELIFINAQRIESLKKKIK